MDFTSYIPAYQAAVENRLFLALVGVVAAFFLDVVHGTLFRHRADPRPLLERAVDGVLGPLVRRLNRAGRPDTTLVMRGMFVLVLACVLFFGVTAGGYIFARLHGHGGTFLIALLALSCGTVGWFAPLRALAGALGNPKAARPYMILARATYTNLMTLDDSGMIRIAATAAVRSILLRLAGPVVLFVLFGWQALALYWPVMGLALSAGRDGTDHAFALVTNGLATLALLIPSLLSLPLVLLALLLSAGASFFRALPGMVRVTRWPARLQGGLPLMLVAYAMKLMLGGPRQDLSGLPVAAPWVGPDGGTARLTVRDIGRVLYFCAVMLLLWVCALYVLAVAV